MPELARALAARCELLGLEAWPLLVLGLDAGLLLIVAGAAVGRLAAADWSPSRRLLASGLVLLAIVVLPATVLGLAGLLAAHSLVAVHAALALAAVALTPGQGLATKLRAAGRGALQPVGAALRPIRRALSRTGWAGGERRAESALTLAIVAVLAFYAVLAVFTLPLNYDANTYRLSRIALWLQDGSIQHFATNDSRQNFIGQNADLVMLWLVSFFRRGYPLAHLAQYAAGLLACAAVYEIASQLGLARRWRLAGVLTLLGMPTATTQFFTAQTDLFVAGSLAAGLGFLLPALRGGRLADWALLGSGVGLALGAKATVLYWGPGLALWALAWAALEGRGARAVGRGLWVALAVALPFTLFNFVSNVRDYGHPVAPKVAIERVHGVGPSFGDKLLFNLAKFSWQLFDANSNPLIPRRLLEPAASALLEVAAPRDERPQALMNRAQWLARGLSEDYASFGLLAIGLAAAGTVRAATRWRLRRDRQGLYVVALALALVAFVLVFCSLHYMGIHQFRYFCLLAPGLAVLGADALAGARGGVGRVAAGLILVAHLATAGYVGVASLHHGARALRDPRAAPWYPHWEDARSLLGQLKDAPLRVGIALPMDSWLAPYLRSGADDRFTMVTGAEIAAAQSLGGLLASRGLDALMVAPAMVRSLASDDVWIHPAPRILRSPRLALRRLRPGEMPRPALVEAIGFSYGGWTRGSASLRLARWRSGRFSLQLENPTDLARELTAASSLERLHLEVPPNATIELALAVAAEDDVALAVTPPFVPPQRRGAEGDADELGLLVSPSAIRAEAGLHADLWTEPHASFRLVNWISGVLELSLSNPTPLRRQVVARSGSDEVTVELAPGATTTLALAVLPLDTVSIAVSPEFVPSASVAGASDDRALGLLLAADDLRPPVGGVFR